MKKKFRVLLIFLFIISGISVYSLIIYAFKENLNLYFTPSQISQGKAPNKVLFRVGGIVESGSLKYQNNLIYFTIKDNKNSIKVVYQGILPNLFKEDTGVVLLGKLLQDGNIFEAKEVLARHDENYIPVEVNKALLD